MLFPAKQMNLPERPTESLLGDNPSGRAFGRMGQTYMGRANSFGKLVAGLTADEFLLLREAVDERRCRDEVGVGTLAEAAAACRPRPGCPGRGAWRYGSPRPVYPDGAAAAAAEGSPPHGTVLEHCRKPLAT